MSGGIRLDSLPKDEVKQWINSFDNVLTDCDGMKVIRGYILDKFINLLLPFRSAVAVHGDYWGCAQGH